MKASRQNRSRRKWTETNGLTTKLSDRRDKSMTAKLKRARKPNRPRRFAGARGYAAALEYATRLATGMWERDWKEESPRWKPFDDLLGVLTQIDNMLAGMEKKNRHNDKVSDGYRR